MVWATLPIQRGLLRESYDGLVMALPESHHNFMKMSCIAGVLCQNREIRRLTLRASLHIIEAYTYMGSGHLLRRRFGDGRAAISRTENLCGQVFWVRGAPQHAEAFGMVGPPPGTRALHEHPAWRDDQQPDRPDCRHTPSMGASMKLDASGIIVIAMLVAWVSFMGWVSWRSRKENKKNS